ncbi:MAG: leucine-rich repeat domain-containing protein, partial [Bacteroidales bacterium]|nr:leucine-rich repeat domain-containing protein [Bacteroidales bacterium]
VIIEKPKDTTAREKVTLKPKSPGSEFTRVTDTVEISISSQKEQDTLHGYLLFCDDHGEISTKLQSLKKDSVRMLKVTGVVNSDDLYYIGNNFSSLEFLDLEDCSIIGKSIPEGLFDSEKREVKLRRIIFPSDLKSIERKAFALCRYLEGPLVFPKTLKSIGEHAFYSCRLLKGPLILPEDLETIGSWAFAKCTNITGPLTLPGKINEIGSQAFTYCYSLTGDLKIPSSVKIVRFAAFCECRGFDGNLILPAGLKEIEKHAFSYCKNLRGELKLPETLVNIGIFAFAGCSSFTGTLEIPHSIEKIGMKAFFMCDSLSCVSVKWSYPIAYTSNMFPGEIKISVPAEYIKEYEKSLGWSNHNLVAEIK